MGPVAVISEDGTRRNLVTTAEPGKFEEAIVAQGQPPTPKPVYTLDAAAKRFGKGQNVLKAEWQKRPHIKPANENAIRESELANIATETGWTLQPVANAA
jgi:hypothetical protein